jgi:transcriptional regulator with XRE-family HTH domain
MPSGVVTQYGMKLNMRVPNGWLLKAARIAVGVHQAQLAREAGLDPSTLSRIENSGAKPVSATARNLEALLEVLRRHGVEVLDDGLRLTKRRR